MAKYKVEILLAAWQDIDKIADFHMKMVGTASAQRITDKILDPIWIASTSMNSPMHSSWPIGGSSSMCVQYGHS